MLVVSGAVQLKMIKVGPATDNQPLSVYTSFQQESVVGWKLFVQPCLSAARCGEWRGSSLPLCLELVSPGSWWAWQVTHSPTPSWHQTKAISVSQPHRTPWYGKIHRGPLAAPQDEEVGWLIPRAKQIEPTIHLLRNSCYRKLGSFYAVLDLACSLFFGFEM